MAMKESIQSTGVKVHKSKWRRRPMSNSRVKHRKKSHLTMFLCWRSKIYGSIVPRDTRSDIVHATFNASYIWDHCEVLTLTKNMRLQNGTNSTNSEDIHHFSEWILQVNDGRIFEPNDRYVEISIPKELLIQNFEDPIQEIVKTTIPNLLENYIDPDFL